jgi:nicotinamide-nucleotide amidase
METIYAELISIGDEILSGWTMNTNAAWLAQKLAGIGLSVRWITCIADSNTEIETALEIASRRAEVIICTGGLGPTPDDLTKHSICKFFNTKLGLNQKTLTDIEKIFEGRNLRMPDVNRNQAMVPQSAKIVTNRFGTAPGLLLEKNGKVYYFLPGVPMEMKAMVENLILKQLKQKFQFSDIRTILFRTTGIPESRLFEKIEATLKKHPQFQVSFLPKSIGVDIRIKYTDNQDISEDLLNSFQDELRATIKKYIYSEKEIDLSEVIGKILIDKELTLSIAESFTGGLISDWITDVPGSSAYLLGSVTTYSNDSKVRLLGVSSKMLEKWGAVSEQTAVEMVQGVQHLYQSDCAIASTGIAGPTGATATKPVGLCYLAAKYRDVLTVKQFKFGKNRRFNKERGATAGLEILRRLILSN